jgi:hypothetical protein
MKFSSISSIILAGLLPHCLAKKKKKDKKQVSLKTRPHGIAKFKTCFHYDHVGRSAKHNIALHIVAQTSSIPLYISVA